MKKSIIVLATLAVVSFSCKTDQKTKERPLDFDNAPSSLELLYSEAISTSLYERDFALSPSRDEVIYTLGNYDQSLRVLVSIKKENGKWGNKIILPISGSKYNDIEPFFSPDGNKLFFASNRPIYGDSLRSDYNIWVATKLNGNWSNPVALDSTINTKGQEYYPAVTKSGNLYFTATKPNGIGLEDIYLSKPNGNSYQVPTVLDSMINSASYEFNAYVSPDEDLIIYSSYGRADGFGGGDLYYSKKDASGNWQAAKNFGEPINSNKLDFCPFYDTEKQVLYFSSLRVSPPNSIDSVEKFIELTEQSKNGLSNIYRIPLSDHSDFNK